MPYDPLGVALGAALAGVDEPQPRRHVVAAASVTYHPHVSSRERDLISGARGGVVFPTLGALADRLRGRDIEAESPAGRSDDGAASHSDWNRTASVSEPHPSLPPHASPGRPRESAHRHADRFVCCFFFFFFFFFFFCHCICFWGGLGVFFFLCN
jgi:hypothetical protein